MKKPALSETKYAVLTFLLFLCACAGEREKLQTPTSASPGGYYKVGNPYQIKGNWYYPEENYSYDESGIASWYGADFHEKLTANGEVYNKNELTAAHKTLPMPSLARVTNLENGRSIVVRINDRGPYSGARIIDVSQRSAQLLGFEKAGVAKVRVQVMADESKAIAEAMRTYNALSPDQARQTAASSGEKPQIAQAAIPTIQNVKPVPQYVQRAVSGNNNIYVQAGSFTNKENAVRLKDKLSKLGVVSVAEALVKGTTFYRVRLGPVDTVARADKLLGSVQGSGVAEARIVVAD